jgi:hypothetical protein
VLILETRGAERAQRGVRPRRVVELVDEPRKVGGDVFERLVGGQIDGLDRERLHEVFGLGSVVRIAALAHRANRAVAGQQRAGDLRCTTNLLV